MNTAAYFLRVSWNNIQRGGQRVFVALLCIAFGVMSLVAMTLLSQAIDRTTVLHSNEMLGADISLDRQNENILSPEAVSQLDALQKSGLIQRYTLIAYNSSLTFRLQGSGEIHFAAAGMGIEPDKYPLVGSLALGYPGNVGASTLLQEAGDILITRDLAEENYLHVGGTLILADLHQGVPVEGRIRGIANDTPNHQGSKIYYTLETAERLANGQRAVNTALVAASNPAAVSQKLGSSGWNTYMAKSLADSNREAQNLIDTLLKGAGILGLLVGGIGVANTMQVLLRRRQREVAIWKALGYREVQLQGLFAMEAGLLGAFGSLVGAGLGLVVSIGLVQLFSRTSNLLITWVFSPFPLVSGMLVGMLTTVIFALWAIVATSQVQPMALLRNEPVDASRLSRIKSAGLAVILGLPFTAITSLVMGSLLSGIGVLLFALAGLAVLGGLLGGLAWVVTCLLPVRSLPLIHMAQNSLRRRGLSLIFAMIALFVGTAALGLGVVVTQNAQRTMDERTVKVEGYNLRVIAPSDQEQAVRQAIKDQKIESYTYRYQAPVKHFNLGKLNEDMAPSPALIGSLEPGEYQIQGAPWGQSEGVYAPQYTNIPAGSQVQAVLEDGQTLTLNVVGAYDIEWNGANLPPEMGLLMPASYLAKLSAPSTVMYLIKVPDGQAGHTSAALGEALPGATVINLEAYAARFSQQYHNLFVLAVAMAGLALLAGVLLVANSVSLAMLDRRYEIGVLKAVGYSRLHILTSLTVEYSLVALIAAAAALAAVQIFLLVLGMLNGLAGSLLVLTPQAVLSIGLCGLGLPLITVLGVTWKPTQAPPVVLLNERT